MSIRIPETRTTSREGVNAAQAFFECMGCVFQEVDQQNDFGKDAYVDLAIDGYLTPLCVALQIKSGESFRTVSGDYFITIGSHADNWRNSTVPVFGLVYDPKDQLIRWADLTGYLRANPHQQTGSITVSQDMLLNETSLLGSFRNAVAICAAASNNVALNLLSLDDSVQIDAVYDAWALGRREARYLIILRRLILHLRPQAIWRAIHILAHLTLHPDILRTPDNWIPPEVEEQVKPSFSWSPEEIAHMLHTMEGEVWGRGTFGQSLDILIYQDPNALSKLRYSIDALLKNDNLEIAVCAAALALSYSRNAQGELASIIGQYPSLLEDEWFCLIREHINEWGFFSFY